MAASGQPASAAEPRPQGPKTGGGGRADPRGHPLRTTEPYGPLTDLRPVGRSVGCAHLVGLGEGSHGTHEFFTLQHRLFRYLVREKGFASFAREAGRNAGPDVNEWLQGGPGDIRQFIREDFQADWVLFATEEWAQLYEWMRADNSAISRFSEELG